MIIIIKKKARTVANRSWLSVCRKANGPNPQP